MSKTENQSNDRMRIVIEPERADGLHEVLLKDACGTVVAQGLCGSYELRRPRREGEDFFLIAYRGREKNMSNVIFRFFAPDAVRMDDSGAE